MNYTKLSIILFVLIFILLHTPAVRAVEYGYTIHFDFLNSEQDAMHLLEFAKANKAGVINLVPPACVWKNSLDKKILSSIFKFCESNNIKIILTRIDASHTGTLESSRENDLYESILDRRGLLPDGSTTPDFFCATVGNAKFEKWQREETAYYARRYAKSPALIGFSIGMFNETFVSQRGSLLCYMNTMRSYMIAQYTNDALRLWHRHLSVNFAGDIAKMNLTYGTSFRSFRDVPLPKSPVDQIFKNPSKAYIDFASTINSWVLSQYDELQSIWHAEGSKNIPFIWQYSGGDLEKFEKGPAELLAIDIVSWIDPADALGLSLYTNTGFTDNGHSSIRATANILHYATILGKKIFVLETGYEDNGAVLSESEFQFLNQSALRLSPETILYEFLRMDFYEHFLHDSGKIISKNWEIRNDTRKEVVQTLFNTTQSPGEASGFFYLYNNPHLKLEKLNNLKQIIIHAMNHDITPVTKNGVDKIPAGSTIIIDDDAMHEKDSVSLKNNGKRTVIGLNEYLLKYQ